ncbi:MAG: cytosolic protein [Candidatus Lokiarchaeota archaeon]|nr:cytosolic protein [Candidatus Lokiarchaeota archaeon]MBD3340410.1 cytosolic protein [Candidatus Lokiarchaeota archaeon]
MTECNQSELEKNCACTYNSCKRRGKCCECLQYHLRNNELPGCVFAKISKEAERSYDRSFRYFANLVSKK